MLSTRTLTKKNLPVLFSDDRGNALTNAKLKAARIRICFIVDPIMKVSIPGSANLILLDYLRHVITTNMIQKKNAIVNDNWSRGTA